jgi:hypothetical protein
LNWQSCLPQSDKRSAEEFERIAGCRRFTFGYGCEGRADYPSRIETSGESGKQGFIKWLEFRVDLRVPCDFSAIAGSAEISVDHGRVGKKEEKESDV